MRLRLKRSDEKKGGRSFKGEKKRKKKKNTEGEKKKKLKMESWANSPRSFPLLIEGDFPLTPRAQQS